MAGENTLTFSYTASSVLGLDLYAMVFKPDMSMVFNNTTGLFEAYNPSNRDDYGLVMTEYDTSDAESVYYASNTGEILASVSYPCFIYVQAGASPAAGDTRVGNGTLGPEGVRLLSDGLDLVLVEAAISASSALVNDSGTQLTSVNARQALAALFAALAGKLSGAAGTTVDVKPAAKPSASSRVTATVDTDGNRTPTVVRVPD